MLVADAGEGAGRQREGLKSDQSWENGRRKREMGKGLQLPKGAGGCSP